jgi:hypothetical protein
MSNVLKSGSLILLETSGPVLDGIGIALPLLLYKGWLQSTIIFIKYAIFTSNGLTVLRSEEGKQNVKRNTNVCVTEHCAGSYIAGLNGPITLNTINIQNECCYKIRNDNQCTREGSARY